MRFIEREKKSLLILLGPVSLVVSIFLLFKPNFDEYEMPVNEGDLIKIEGFANRSNIKDRTHSRFITVYSGSIEYQVKLKCNCKTEAIGTNVSILASPDTMGRSIYVAWQLVSNGNIIYSLNESMHRHRAGYSTRTTHAWWGLFLGIIFTPIWYFSTKKHNATISDQ